MRLFPTTSIELVKIDLEFKLFVEEDGLTLGIKLEDVHFPIPDIDNTQLNTGQVLGKELRLALHQTRMLSLLSQWRRTIDEQAVVQWTGGVNLEVVDIWMIGGWIESSEPQEYASAVTTRQSDCGGRMIHRRVDTNCILLFMLNNKVHTNDYSCNPLVFATSLTAGLKEGLVAAINNGTYSNSTRTKLHVEPD